MHSRTSPVPLPVKQQGCWLAQVPLAASGLAAGVLLHSHWPSRGRQGLAEYHQLTNGLAGQVSLLVCTSCFFTDRYMCSCVHVSASKHFFFCTKMILNHSFLFDTKKYWNIFILWGRMLNFNVLMKLFLFWFLAL